MAIDTRNKRGACLGINGIFRAILPAPDVGVEAEEDRLQLAYCYILVVEPPPPPPPPPPVSAEPKFKFYPRHRRYFG